ncbi:ubiquitin-like small modifier protein 1 [Natrinema caseinilyticum]|uniref:ubiquitin-like small modifier protein 1 n=1 Tax=Natrinema caseinilyticum TaxID=2961570 RepID=UPI0020C588C7|nr:ubiquitin-like small modifier protein 1 [Natrinema caseinilyticum]
MEVEVTLFGPLRDPVGEKSITLSLPADATVEDVLDQLTADFPSMRDPLYGDYGSISDNVVLTKNKVNIATLEGVETKLSDGDTLRLSPPVTGGTGVEQ